MSLPAASRRLFPELVLLPEDGEGEEAREGEALDPQAHAPFVIGRLLEDGDGADLAWLVRTYGRERLAAWLRTRGRRQLSRRSQAFWQILLETEAGPTEPDSTGLAHELWPL